MECCYVHRNLINAATFLEMYLIRSILVMTRNETSVTIIKHVFNNLTALENQPSNHSLQASRPSQWISSL
jgi:hypothetical protein